MAVLTYAATLLQGGLGNLASYLAAHVLLCLVPAFFIAGALTALVPQEIVTRYLGRDAPKWVSYPAAVAGGLLLEVCSCTGLPVFAAIYKGGAGLGPAITFLFTAPAINILSLVYTAAVIGMDFTLARLVLSVVFGIGIGLIMAFMYRRDDQERESSAFSSEAKANRAIWVFLALLVTVLIVGTFQLGPLQRSYAHFASPFPEPLNFRPL